MNEIKTVFGFTFKNVITKRAYKVTTLLMLVLVVGICFIPKLLGTENDPGTEDQPPVTAADYNFYYIDEDNLIDGGLSVLKEAYPQANVLAGDNNKFDDYKAEAESNMNTTLIVITEKDGRPDAVLYTGGLMSTNNPERAIEILNIKYIENTMRSMSISSEIIEFSQFKMQYNVGFLTDVNLSGYILGIIMMFIMFFAIYYYGYSVASTVGGEKSSRVMETLIVSAKPKNILLGKLFATAASGLMQLSLVIAAFMISYSALVPDDFTIGGMPLSLDAISLFTGVIILLYFLGGFMLYATMFAVCGATVSRSEDMSSAIMPMSFILMVAFYSSYIASFTGTESLKNIISLIPFTGIFTMPTKLLNENIDYFYPIVGLLILYATALFMIYFAMKIYSVSVLQYGARIKLKNLFKIKM